MRLRYRTEMSENLTEAESQALNRDIGQLEALIEELLTYARLDRPQNELKLTTPNFPAWLGDRVEDIQAVNPQRDVALSEVVDGNYGALDMRLMERVLDNLVNNALRYSNQRIQVSLTLQGSRATLRVEDDGPVSRPLSGRKCSSRLFVSTPAAIAPPAAAVLVWLSSTVLPVQWLAKSIAASELGGACFCFSWPVYHQLPNFTSA